jgi:protein-S-isoprenylcysteine O-methyltransferase Ste14
MDHKLASVKAAAIATLVAIPLGVMVFVPLWFVLAVLSRLTTGQIHRVTFVVAGIAAAAFMVWVFRMAFSHFRRRIEAKKAATDFHG